LANEIPSSDTFSGLSKVVIQYSERFTKLMKQGSSAELTEADWADIEALVDVDGWQRQGVFMAAEAESFGWPTYRAFIQQYAGAAAWEGTLRNITETQGRVLLELEERSTSNGVTHVANTVTVYEFSDGGKLNRLEVYVMPLREVAA
jgi:hypothetical protein